MDKIAKNPGRNVRLKIKIIIYFLYRFKLRYCMVGVVGSLVKLRFLGRCAFGLVVRADLE